VGGALIQSYADGDVAYFGESPVAYFETRFGYDAMASLSLEPEPNEAIPEPSSLALVLGGLAALHARRRRRG